MTGVISVVLLLAGLVIVVASCAGMAVLDDPLDRMHLTTPAAMLGSTGICASIVVREGLSDVRAGRHRRRRHPDQRQSAGRPCGGPRHRDPARGRLSDRQDEADRLPRRRRR